MNIKTIYKQCKRCNLPNKEAQICKNCSHYGELKQDDTITENWCKEHHWSSPPWESCNDFVSV